MLVTRNDLYLLPLCAKNILKKKRVAILVKVFFLYIFPQAVLYIFAVMLTFSPQSTESQGKPVLFLFLY